MGGPSPGYRWAAAGWYSQSWGRIYSSVARASNATAFPLGVGSVQRSYTGSVPRGGCGCALFSRCSRRRRGSCLDASTPKLAQFSGDVRAAALRGDELSGVRPYTVRTPDGSQENVYVLALEGDDRPRVYNTGCVLYVVCVASFLLSSFKRGFCN